MEIHAPTVQAIGNIIAENRVRLGMSMRDCGELAKLIREKTGVSVSLSYKALVQREEPFKAKALSLLGNLPAVLSFLLRRFPVDLADPPVVIMTSDAYKTGNAFRSATGRKRLAVGLMSGATATRFLTVRDQRKGAFSTWWALTCLPSITLLQTTASFRRKDAVFSLRAFRIAGDHGELWSYFLGMGGRGHRSAFCATPCDSWLGRLHRCPRLSIQELHESGFECHFASRFDLPCYAVTPALHDIKGVIKIIVDTIPCGHKVEQEVLGSGGTGHNNMTGRQARLVLRALMQQVKGSQCLLCCAMDHLVYFRYQDIPIRFYYSATPKDYHTDILLGLVSYHLLVFLLDWANPGSTISAYVHSLEHWFDPEDAHRLQLSDEYFEQMNGERKRWAALTSQQTMERDFQGFELQLKHLDENMCPRILPALEAVSAEKSVFHQYGSLSFCTCITARNETWKVATKSLVARLNHLGLGDYVKRGVKGHGKKFLLAPEKVKELNVCVCEEKSWLAGPVPAALPSEESISSSESEEDEHLCVICRDLFSSITGLFAHYDAAHRPPLAECLCKQVCPFCAKSTSTKGLSQHLLYRHAEKLTKTFCPICMLCCASVKQRDKHMIEAH